MLNKETTPVSPRARKTPPPPKEATGTFQILVTCKDEADQRAVYERLTKEGRPCRVLIL